MTFPLIGKPWVTKEDGAWWVYGLLYFGEAVTHEAARKFNDWSEAVAFANKIAVRRRA